MIAAQYARLTLAIAPYVIDAAIPKDWDIGGGGHQAFFNTPMRGRPCGMAGFGRRCENIP
jgi:hypothetical protein